MKYSGYNITFTIEDSFPSIWRNLEIPANINFYEMHKIIQAIFSWTNKKDYGFFFNEEIEICDTRKEGAKVLSLCKNVLDIKVPIKKVINDYSGCKYIYNQSWEVNISWQGIASKDIKEIKCVDGQHASPPEEAEDIYNYYSISCKCNGKRYFDNKKLAPLNDMEEEDCELKKYNGLCVNNYNTRLINENLYNNFI